MQIWVYLLRCADGAFYVGTHRGPDPADREAEHNAGVRREAWTYERRPVKLVWTSEFEDPFEAVAFERQLKGWSRAKKEALIRGDWNAIRAHARRRSRPAEEAPEPRRPRPPRRVKEGG